MLESVADQIEQMLCVAKGIDGVPLDFQGDGPPVYILKKPVHIAVGIRFRRE